MCCATGAGAAWCAVDARAWRSASSTGRAGGAPACPLDRRLTGPPRHRAFLTAARVPSPRCAAPRGASLVGAGRPRGERAAYKRRRPAGCTRGCRGTRSGWGRAPRAHGAARRSAPGAPPPRRCASPRCSRSRRCGWATTARCRQVRLGVATLTQGPGGRGARSSPAGAFRPLHRVAARRLDSRPRPAAARRAAAAHPWRAGPGAAGGGAAGV
jgi:hypothetical protein